ncbi:MAG: RtcB family protein, partial [Anaerolineae bacterium]|nr:RtcB family protein [Anaerolineae bacterium]
FAQIPAGLGSTGILRLNAHEMDAMLAGGARWAIERGYGKPEELERIEEHGCVAGADPAAVSAQAKQRQRDEMGTLGSVSLFEKNSIKNCQSTRYAAPIFRGALDRDPPACQNYGQRQ